MTDLPARLRELADWLHSHEWETPIAGYVTCSEAAEEIEGIWRVIDFRQKQIVSAEARLQLSRGVKFSRARCLRELQADTERMLGIATEAAGKPQKASKTPAAIAPSAGERPAMEMNQSELDAFVAKTGAKVTASRSVAECLADLERPKSGKPNLNAMQDRKPGDRMKSKWERLFAAECDDSIKRGELPRWTCEGIGLRLPDWGIYWCDFNLYWPDGIEMVEVKGKGKFAVRDKAKAKFLDARRLFPQFKFRMIQRTESGWEEIL